ncbi:MAG TPA: hypothetical protein VFN10_02750, partial [Thermoanaerobaculia bacterium]|nr:hypothetical protein [Thermoanaerobaculia bacterium]
MSVRPGITVARLAALCLLFVAALAAPVHAQTCTAPAIVQAGGTNPSCAGQPVTLDAGAGWATYQWSTGATTRFMTDAPTDTTAYTVTVTDGNGCSVTSQPLQVVVNPAPPPPGIHVSEAAICGDAIGHAETYATGTLFWTLTNATLLSPQSSSAIEYRAISGGPITLSVTSTDANGCTSMTDPATVYALPATPPELSGPTSICPYQSQTVSIAPPPGAASWEAVSWTISNGAFRSNYGDVTTLTTTTPTATFYGNGTADVVIQAIGYKSSCGTDPATLVVPLRSVAEPVIQTVTEVCSYQRATATIAPPAEGTWNIVSWSITNGSFSTPYGSSTWANGETVQYSGNGNGPITLQVTAEDSFGCTTPPGAVQVALRTIPEPVIETVTEVCPYSSATATLRAPAEGTWSIISWSITNGSFSTPYGNSQWANGETVHYHGNGNGPITLQVTAEDSFGCTSPPAAVQVALRTIAEPVIQTVTQVCPYARATATLRAPAEGTWNIVSWSITNGSFITPYGNASWANGESVDYYGNGNGPITLQVTAEDSFNCTSPPAGVQVAIRTIAEPVIDTVTQVCPNSTATATVRAPAQGTWDLVAWSITNGSFITPTGPSSWTNGETVTYRGNGNGPITLQVTAQDSFGCTSPPGVAQVAMRTIPAPVIDTIARVCPNVPTTATVRAPAEGSWDLVAWSITNGSFVTQNGSSSWTNGLSVTYVANGAGPVTLQVTAADNLGCTAPETSAQVALRTGETPVVSTVTEICPNQEATATLVAPADGSWQDVAWSITNGSFITDFGTSQSASGLIVRYTANGSGPVSLSVFARDSYGCDAATEGGATVNIKQLTPPAINTTYPTACGAQQQTASVAAPETGSWQTVAWSITGGAFPTGANAYGPSVTFVPDSSGQPVVLTATVTSTEGCSTTATKTLQRDPATPIVVIDGGSCPNGAHIANLSDYPAGTTFNWGASSGVPVGPVNGTTFTFAGVNAGLLTVGVEVTTPSGCLGYGNTTVQANATPYADFAFGTGPICVSDSERVDVTTARNVSSYFWTVTGGHIQGAANGPFIRIFVESSTMIVKLITTSANGCTYTVTKTVNAGTAPAGGITSYPASVCAGSTATASTTANGATYTWTLTGGSIVSGQGTPNVTFTAGSGTSMTVQLSKTGSNGCAMSDSKGIAISTATANITASGATTFCEGGNVTLTANTGTSYLWSNGATTQSIVASSSGTYSVTVTQGACSATASQSVTVNPLPATPVVTASGSTALCPGGTVTLTAPAGYTYLWSNAATTQSIAVTDAGSYSVTVTNANGCSATSTSTNVTINTPPAPTVTAPSNACPSGPVSASVSNATAGWTYVWSATNGAISGSATGSSVNATMGAAGNTTLSVMVTDANGCSTTSSATIQPYAVTLPTITTPSDTICTSSYNNASAPAGYATYQWTVSGDGWASNGWNTPDVMYQATSGATTTLTLRVTDANGCVLTTTKTLTNQPLEKPVITFADAQVCMGIESTASVTNRTYASYYWYAYDGQIIGRNDQQTVHFKADNSYGTVLFCRVSVPNACITEGSGSVTVRHLASPTMTAPTALCSGQSGNAAVNNPSQYATYWWSITNGSIPGPQNGATVQFYAGASGNTTLSLTVTDAQGCSAFQSTTIPVSAVTGPTITAPPQVCTYTTNTASASGGFVSYQWSIENGYFRGPSDQQDVSFQPAGVQPVTLTVIGTTAAGCRPQTSRTLDVTYNNQPVITGAGSSCYPATHTLSILGDPGYVSYLWSNGATTPTITVGTTGDYSVVVTAANGCPIESAPVHVDIWDLPAKPDITVSGPTTFCTGGSVTLTAPAGYQSYQWSNGEMTRSITVTQSGSYSVRVIDAHCFSPWSDAVSVTANAPPSAFITQTPSTGGFCPGTTTMLTASAGSSWLWSTGETTQSIIVSTAGNYSVTVTNASGCSATSSPRTITQFPGPTKPVITANGPTTFCDGGSVTLSVPAPPSGYAYTWSNGSYGNSITVTSSGTYSVTIAGGTYGCSATSDPVTVTRNPIPTASITPSVPTYICEGGSTTLTANDVPGATYLWSNGATTRVISVTTAGYYTVTVTLNGCSKSSGTTYVGVNPRPAKPSISASGSTSLCQGSSVTLSAPSGYSSYLWSTGATTRSIVVSQAGSYSVAVTDSNGCTSDSSDATVVTVNPLPDATVTANGPTTFCAGGNVTLSAADGAASYLWNNGATTRDITVASTGSYYVVATSAAGCSRTSTTTAVTVNPLPTATLTAAGATTFCQGGSVTLNASGGGTYLWNTGATTSSIVVTQSGTYGVTVTNANGCSATPAPITVTVNPLPAAPAITANGPTTFCAGGSVVLTASSGYSAYRWNTGATTQSITVSSSGNYTVTGTGANGCTATSTATSVTALAQPVIGSWGNTGNVCWSNTGYVAQVQQVAGWTYAWTLTGATITSGQGTYRITFNPDATATNIHVSVVATDANGCTSAPRVWDIAVTNPDATITASGPTSFCQGGTVTLTAAAGYTYLWSTGATTRSITVANSGTYTVRVSSTTNTGCSKLSDPVVVTVSQPTTPTISASGATTFCEGGSVTLTSSPSASYLWSNGATTQSITVNASGSYTVTTTDANGCSATSAAKAVTVNTATTPTITASGSTLLCEGANVTLTASAGATYLWSTGATTRSIAAYLPGSYSVTVTDANGCSATSAATIVTTETATVQVSGDTTAICPGGQIHLTSNVTNGTATSYQWYGFGGTPIAGATGPSLTLTPSQSSYAFLRIGTTNGCTVQSNTFTYTVHQPAATITANGPTTFCEGGNVALTANDGASWLWSNGATTQSITVANSGAYNVTVTDANGCSATSTDTVVTVNALPSASISGPSSFCTGSSVTLTASAATSYLWSTGATTQSITVSAGGTYSVTVSNANGCSASASQVVTENALPSASISGPSSFCTGASVTLTAAAASSYLWSTGATTQSITVSAGGTYSVTVSNANGCSASASQVVTENALPTASISGPSSFCTGSSVTLTASAASSYLWSTGAITQSITVSAGGTYSVTVTNTNDCTASASKTVTENALPSASISGASSFCTGSNVTLTASAASSYLWSTGATTQSITVSAGGTYTVTVTNASGCTATASKTVTENALPTASISGASSFCTGSNVTLTASAASSYLWSTGATTQSITVSAGGTYTVSVTNANGCTASASKTVTENALPTASISGASSFCTGSNVTLTASAATSYLWSTGATTQSITVSAGGTYTVTVTNASGCTASASKTVTQNALPSASITGASSFCTGGNVTLTASAASSYLWSTGATTQSITVSAGGTYSVTVTNANGCTASASKTVTENALPTASISGASSFCTGSNVTLTASAASSYLWSTGAITQSITVSAGGTYSVTVTNANGCTASASKTVTENALPSASISGASSFCTGSNVTLTASAATSYLWSTGATTQSITV